MQAPSARTGRIPLLFLGILFTAVGLGILFFLILPTVTGAIGARAYVPVPATVIEADLVESPSSKSTTYRIHARYLYQFDGEEYVGTRVGLSTGSDNIGSWHHDWHARLTAAKADGRTVIAYVDPSEPQQALLDRTPRWGWLGFALIFPVVFGGVGIGMLWGAFARPEAPIAHRRSRDLSNRIVSQAKQRLVGLWFLTVIWNGISAPFFFFLPAEIAAGNWPALIGVFFPLVGIGLLYFALRYTLEWRRFGRVELVMDPYPGAIGGDMGGTIDLAVSASPNHRYRARLSCLRVHRDNRRGGAEEVLWEDEQEPVAAAHGPGTRVVVRFAVPPALPESDSPNDTSILWRLTLNGEIPGVDLDRTFDIPMRRSEACMHAAVMNARNAPPTPVAIPLPLSVVRIHRGARGTEFHYPMGGQLGAGLFLLLFGGSFAMVPFFFADTAPLPLVIIFGLFAPPLILWGLWLPFRSLRVIATSQSLAVERRWLGFRLTRHIASLRTIASLQRKASIKATTLRGTVVYYDLVARTDQGKRLKLAEGLPGQAIARAMETEWRALVDPQGNEKMN